MDIKFIIAIIILLNPFTKVFIFEQITHDLTSKETFFISLKVGLFILVLFQVILFGGINVLNLLDLKLWAFEIAGGLIISYLGWNMLFKSRIFPKVGSSTQQQASQFALAPFTFPITVGPGVISLLLLSSNHSPETNLMAYSLTLLIISIAMTVLFIFSHKIIRCLGKTLLEIINKMMGIIVIAIGIETLFKGLFLLVVNFKMPM